MTPIGGTTLEESVKALQDVFADHDPAEKGEPMPRLNDADWRKGGKKEFRFNQKFLPDFTPPQKIIDEQFAKSVADILFQQLSDGGEKILSISHNLKEEPSGAKYEGKIIIEDIIRCKDCKYSEHWRRDERMCSLWDDAWVFDDGFCNHAERRTE